MDDRESTTGRSGPGPAGPPSAAPRRRRRRALAYALFWGVTVAVAGASSLAIAHLLRQDDARRQTQLVLARIEDLATRLRLLEVEAGQPSPGLAGLPRGEVAELEARLQTELVSLLDLDPQGDAADRVREAASQYLADLDRHGLLLERGEGEESRRWEEERSGPGFDLLAEAIRESSVFYNARAARGLRGVLWGSVAAIAGEAVALGLVALVFARARRRSELSLLQERARSAARFQALVQNSADVIAVLDPSGVVTYISPAVTRLLGYRPEDRIGTSGFALLDAEFTEPVRAAFSQLLDGARPVINRPLKVRHADGSWRWIELSATNLVADPSVGGIVLNYRDITARRQLQEQLRHQALHDPLTGLANRALFHRLAEQALARAARSGKDLGVLFLDLDGFKQINDTLGHQAGDDLLVQVAARLRSGLRAGDSVARLGGDEFAALLEEASADETLAVARRLVEELGAPFTLAGKAATVGCSVGATSGAFGGGDLDEVLRQADAAMYVAKRAGKGRIEVYRSEMETAPGFRPRGAEELARAIEREELALVFQPIVALSSRRVVGVEALVRWRDPASPRPLAPSQFLPVAEESGLIVPLGRWVMRKACHEVRLWQEEFPSEAPLLLSINLSERQLYDEDLVSDLRQALGESRLPPATLVLEVREEVLLRDPERARARMRVLKELGVRLAIDDYGAGFGPPDALGQFPVDVVKIEKNLIDNVSLSSADAAFALQVIGLARELSVQTVAEGIEAEGTAASLDGMGCDLGQGYSLARPLDAPGVEALLRAVATGRDWRRQAAEAGSRRRQDDGSKRESETHGPGAGLRAGAGGGR